MSARDLAADVLLWWGCAALVLAALGTVVLHDLRDRLHAVSVAAVVGVPPVALSLALTAESWSEAAKIVVVVMLLVVPAPATSAVTGRVVGRAVPPGDRPAQEAGR